MEKNPKIVERSITAINNRNALHFGNRFAFEVRHVDSITAAAADDRALLGMPTTISLLEEQSCWKWSRDVGRWWSSSSFLSLDSLEPSLTAASPYWSSATLLSHSLSWPAIIVAWNLALKREDDFVKYHRITFYFLEDNGLANSFGDIWKCNHQIPD